MTVRHCGTKLLCWSTGEMWVLISQRPINQILPALASEHMFIALAKTEGVEKSVVFADSKLMHVFGTTEDINTIMHMHMRS